MSKESRRAARNARSTSTGPSGTPRAGRRERVRHYQPEPTFLEKYRSVIVGIVVVAVAAVVAGLVFVQSTQASYTCTIEFNPSPTPSLAPDSTARLGFQQDSMGASHEVARPQKYTFCPPASGPHNNGVGIGPVTPRVYGPDDSVGPPNWIHNLEHGGLVILYRGTSPGASEAGQRQFQEFFDTFPPSPICELPAGRVSPVIARFDSMPYDYAALVWTRVLPMTQWDPSLAIEFYETESERLDADGAFVSGSPPEPQCLAPSPSPGASQSAAPGASPSAAPASTEPSSGASASPSAAPS